MFYLAIIPSLFIMIIIFIKLVKMRRHDKVLFKFCNLRRKVMEKIRSDNFELSKEDYYSLRNLAENLNISIHYYNHLKISIFNWRKCKEYIKSLNKEDKKVLKLNISNNPEIKYLYDKFTLVLIFAFLNYTPFLKIEILLKISIFILSTIAKYGYDQMNDYIDSLSLVKEKYKQTDILAFN